MASSPTPSPAASSGMGNNMAGALSYITIVGIVFLFIEPYNKTRFVRFHAFQSIFFAVAWFVLWIGWWILSAILIGITHGAAVFIAFPVSMLLWLAGIVLWIVLVVKAYNNQEWQLPVIGAIASKQAGS